MTGIVSRSGYQASITCSTVISPFCHHFHHANWGRVFPFSQGCKCGEQLGSAIPAPATTHLPSAGEADDRLSILVLWLQFVRSCRILTSVGRDAVFVRRYEFGCGQSGAGESRGLENDQELATAIKRGETIREMCLSLDVKVRDFAVRRWLSLNYAVA